MMINTDSICDNVTFVKGDATQPIETGGIRVITHIVNNRKGWGAGFVMALSRKWRAPEEHYRNWSLYTSDPFRLGSVQLVEVDSDKKIFVANCIAQDGYSEPGKPACDINALALCFQRLRTKLGSVRDYHLPKSYHMPRIGTGLGGRKWEEIQPLLALLKEPIYVYDL